MYSSIIKQIFWHHSDCHIQTSNSYKILVRVAHIFHYNTIFRTLCGIYVDFQLCVFRTYSRNCDCVLDKWGMLLCDCIRYLFPVVPWWDSDPYWLDKQWSYQQNEDYHSPWKTLIQNLLWWDELKNDIGSKPCPSYLMKKLLFITYHYSIFSYQ